MSASTFILNEIADDKKSRSNSSIECNVSPMVIMSVLNHFQRRPSNKRQNKNQQRPNLYPSFVLGLLFGHKDPENDSLIINDAFGLEIQINPQNKQVALELSVAKEALKLHAMAHANDRLVGWYRTGLQIETSSIFIHDQIIIRELSSLSNKVSRNAGAALADSEYVHLLIDTALKNDQLSIRAYTTISITDPFQAEQYANYLKEKKRRANVLRNANKSPKSRKKKGKGKESQTAEKEEKEKEKEKEEELLPLQEVEKPFPIFYRFKQVICNYFASESERIGLEMIIESPPEGNSLDSPSMLMNDTNHLESVLQSLLQNLETVQQYVQSVIDGEVEGNESVGWLIGAALSSVPNLSPAKFEQMISNRLQDFLMMVYLGKMTKAQLVIADKINKVLPSTVPGFEVGN